MNQTESELLRRAVQLALDNVENGPWVQVLEGWS